MRPHRNLFLTFLGLSLAPLLLLAGLSYWLGLRMADDAFRRNQERELAGFSNEITEFLALNKNELTKLSRAKPLVHYLVSLPGNSLGNQLSIPGIPPEVQTLTSSVLNTRTNISTVSVFKATREPLFVAEHREFETYQPVDFHTRFSLASQLKPDEHVWTIRQTEIILSRVLGAPAGPYLHLTAPIFSNEQGGNKLVGALLAEVKLDSVFTKAARADRGVSNSSSNWFIVLDPAGKVLYHTNESKKHQPVDVSMPNFAPAANRMLAEESGSASFLDNNSGDRFGASYARVPPLDISVARVSNQSEAFAVAHRNGRIGIVVAVLLGTFGAVVLALRAQKKERGIQRVSEGVEALAAGKLDHKINLRSRDDLKPLADNLAVMTRQLKDQLAREAETQQFQSFVRLSAILTHDLKNAIESLSLTVSNMERHSENAEFREDAMKTLRDATDDLRALVARLSNPVTTLSGEHKLPRSVDIVPSLRRVVSKFASGGPHEVNLKLPESVFALVDIERLPTVIENLIINARESMNAKAGVITVEAGLTADAKPYFSVSDTGEGMSRTFIEEQLFRPFATTKKRGVGLGLYTCREVVRANGGSIIVDSLTGVGTRFLVVLASPPTNEGRENALQTHRRG